MASELVSDFWVSIENQGGDTGNNQYVEDVTGSCIAGIYGQSGLDIDLRGVYVSKKVKNSIVTNVEYTLPTILVSPKILQSEQHTNTLSIDEEQSLSFRDQTNTWSLSMTFTFGETFSCKIPT